ncbi:hypothetical protein ACFU99_00755 [Streptomyces sp. NPDC057654]|uniref:hypothetical protein n=1 Tax=Streptomyces sp. NPDC057654 TaxID=3346196 RepID=UPI003689A3DE
MTETSWPFDSGDGQKVDAQRWQTLTAPAAPSGVIGRWGDAALSVSVSTAQTAAVDVAPGRALVRGFAYQADQAVTLPLSRQTEAQPRIDLVVIEVDMANSRASAKVLKGQPAVAPQPPGVRQIDGGIWQLPLAQVTVKRGTTVVESIRDVRTLFDAGRPPAVNDVDIPSNPVPGDMAYYRSRNTGAEELHMYAAQGGWSIVSAIGKMRTYTPRLNWNGGRYSAVGHYQWISSNTMWFTANITNTSNVTWGGDGKALDISLPTKSRGGIWQMMTASLYNNDAGVTPYEGMPNYLVGSAFIHGGSTCQPVLQSYRSLIAGGDWWTRFPKGSTMVVTGVYEADYYHEGN